MGVASADPEVDLARSTEAALILTVAPEVELAVVTAVVLEGATVAREVGLAPTEAASAVVLADPEAALVNRTAMALETPEADLVAA